MTLSQSLKPSVPKRGLLAIAGVFWTFAGGMLLSRGIFGLLDEHANLYIDISIALVGGAILLAFIFKDF